MAVYQLGARRHYAVPAGLAVCGQLARLVTDFAAFAPPLSWLRTWPEWAMPQSARRLAQRFHPRISPARVRTIRSVWAKGPRRSERQTLTDFFCVNNELFCTQALKVGFGGADTVYCYNGAGLEVLRCAKQMGLTCVIDQTAAPWRFNRDLLDREAQAFPDWDLDQGEIDQSGAMIAREEAEWQLADCIVCGSEFAAEAVRETAKIELPLEVVRYPRAGAFARKVLAKASDHRKGNNNKTLRILTVGTLQLRKGVQYLAQAAAMLASDAVEFRLVGPNGLTTTALAQLECYCTIVGALTRAEIVTEMANADIFVLPTLSEGSANVVREAMAIGLPVVTTSNSGGRIVDGQNGLLVPARNAAALAAAIQRLIDDEGLRHELGSAAQAGSLADTDADYGANIVSAIDRRRQVDSISF